jgi:ActR/RegA family two-component response regulator
MDGTDVRSSAARPDPELKPPVQPTRHVLFVIDDELYASTVERWLGRRGWQITRASFGFHQALEQWRACGAAVVLVDLDGDGLGGFTLLAAAQALRPPRKAVICTRDPAVTHLPESTRQRLGIEAIVMRPCHLDVVLAALERAAVAARSANSDEQEEA